MIRSSSQSRLHITLGQLRDQLAAALRQLSFFRRPRVGQTVSLHWPGLGHMWLRASIAYRALCNNQR